MPSRFARDIRKLPNVISLSRIVLLWVGGAFLFYGAPVVGIVIAVIAGLTDYVDGAVARATGQVTRLGEILDQTCDLCFESLVLLIGVAQGFFPPVFLFIYLFREFWVMCIRRFMAQTRQNIPSTIWGKLKSNFVAWGCLPSFVSMANLLPQAEPYVGYLGKFGVAAGLVFSYLSGLGYTRAFVTSYNRTDV